MKHRAFFCGAGFVLALVLGCNFGGMAQSMPGGFSRQISGQVRYADSHDPADHVLVRIESFEGGGFNEIMTDRTGKFSFSGLGAVSYQVTVHAPGYLDYSERIDLQVTPTGYLNVLLVLDKSSIQNRTNQLIKLGAPGVVDANAPPEAKNEYTAGMSLLDQGGDRNVTEATKHFGKALTIYPKFLDAELMLGLAYMDLAQWDQAEKALLAAIEINEKAATPYFALGDIYTRQKNYSKATEALTKGLKLNDSSSDAHYMLANTYWTMAEAGSSCSEPKQLLEASWKEVSRALELNPKLAPAHLLSGNLLLKARRNKEALEHFQEYLKLEPKGTFAQQTKALVEKLKKALAQAEKNS